MANIRTTGPEPLTERRREILDTIIEHQRAHGYPPSIREICAANGLKSPASAKNHLDVLKAAGYLKIAADRPRAITVCYDSHTGAAAERRPARHVPLVGDRATGSEILTAGNIRQLLPVPVDLTGPGKLFMLRMRGSSMSAAGILDGDYVVCRVQSTANDGDIIAASVPGDETIVRRFRTDSDQTVLEPADTAMAPLRLDPADVSVHGRVVSVLRKV